VRFLFLDLELNQPSGKIIQVGACVADLASGQIRAEMRVFVNPGERLSPAVERLTGIAQAQVNKGECVADAYERLKGFHSAHGCEASPLTWGEDDSGVLRRELEAGRGAVDGWPFWFRSTDVRAIYVGYAISRGLAIDGGLSEAMKRLGLSFLGRRHDALADAKNTFLIAHRMLAPGAGPPGRRG
jgi:inhibitor of KinA sporulation pathway (predicted exonuclease)